MKHKVLLAEDDSLTRELWTGLLDKTGYEPIAFTNPVSAINYLEDDSKGYPNHRDVSLIISDYQFDGYSETGYNFLQARNRLDFHMPFFLVSGQANNQELTKAGKYGIDAYLQKPFDFERINKYMTRTFSPNFAFKKPLVLAKIGGSADDFDNETESKALYHTLQQFVKLQEDYQVILTVGAGKIGDKLKRNVKKYRDFPNVVNSFPTNINKGLAINMDLIHSLIPDRSVCVSNFNLSGRTPLYIGGDSYNLADTPQMLRFSDKVIIIATPPRYMRQEHTDIVDPSHIHYPLIPLEDSDASTFLLAEYFGVKKPLIFLKRTDGVYRKDPLDGMEVNNEIWKKIQENNNFIKSVTYDEMLLGKLNDGNPISFRGAWDKDLGHCIETSAAKLARKLGLEVGLAHISPLEMYVEGHHVITGNPIPYGATEDSLRMEMIQKIITGEKSDFRP